MVTQSDHLHRKDLAVSLSIDQLEIGQSAEMEKLISEQDVMDFARLSGDHNPVHLDEDFAANSQFGQRIVHGILTASHISALVASKLPGRGSIYLGQSLKFLRPVPLNSVVVTHVSIATLDLKKYGDARLRL